MKIDKKILLDILKLMIDFDDYHVTEKELIKLRKEKEYDVDEFNYHIYLLDGSGYIKVSENAFENKKCEDPAVHSCGLIDWLDLNNEYGAEITLKGYDYFEKNIEKLN